MDFKLELVLVPVSDVDRAKAFYVEKAGFVDLDVDFSPGPRFPGGAADPAGVEVFDHHRQGPVRRPGWFLQGDPPGGQGHHRGPRELIGRGVEVSDIRHMGAGGWQPGVDPNHADYASFADFADPDGNTWVLQEVPVGKG